MKKLLISCALIFISCLSYAEVIKIVDFEGRQQEQSNWCWAASIQAIFLTSGLKVSQSNIVTAAYGGLVNKTAPGFEGTLNVLNGLGVSADGSIWKVNASAVNTFPDANWLLKKLENGEPVMIWYKDENSNHSIVINGGNYTKDRFGNVSWHQISAFDPWENRNMTIDASNIPRYVYGSFEVELEEVSYSEDASRYADSDYLEDENYPEDEEVDFQVDEDSEPEIDEATGCPLTTSIPRAYIRQACVGITKPMK